MTNAIGILKFFNTDKGFGFIKTDGDDVFVHASNAGDYLDKLVEGAQVEYELVKPFEHGKWQKPYAVVTSVTAPAPKPVAFPAWCIVDWYNVLKGFGFAYFEANGQPMRAFLHRSVCKKADPSAELVPGPGTVMKAMVIETPRGFNIVSFEAGKHITEESMLSPIKLSTDGGVSSEVSVEVSETPAATVETELAQKKRPNGKNARMAEGTPGEKTPTVAEAKPAKKATPKSRAKVIRKEPLPADIDGVIAASKADGPLADALRQAQATKH